MYNHINMTFATSNNPTIRYFCTRKIGYIYIYIYTCISDIIVYIYH